VFENIRADTIRASRCSDALSLMDALHLLLRTHGLQALAIYRFGRWLRGLRKHSIIGAIIALPLYPVYWMLSYCVRKAYGIDLDQTANIAPGLYIGHFGGIEVKNCRIGPRCAIGQQVKLGPAEPMSTGPDIGEAVWIGAHARICADIRIGDGATIGPGAVVNQDIPHRCLVLGNPGRIAQCDYDNRAFL
jgi:serine O-acetyltransferase